MMGAISVSVSGCVAALCASKIANVAFSHQVRGYSLEVRHLKFHKMIPSSPNFHYLRRRLMGGEPSGPQGTAGIVGSREIGQAHPVVHRWPERPIGETIIVLLTIKRRQVHQRVLNPPFVDHSGLGCRLGSYLAAPTEPEALIGLKCLSQCNGQAARGSFVRGIGKRYPVRDDDETRQRSAPRRLFS